MVANIEIVENINVENITTMADKDKLFFSRFNSAFLLFPSLQILPYSFHHIYFIPVYLHRFKEGNIYILKLWRSQVTMLQRYWLTCCSLKYIHSGSICHSYIPETKRNRAFLVTMCASGELYIETTIQPREEIHTVSECISLAMCHV